MAKAAEKTESEKENLILSLQMHNKANLPKINWDDICVWQENVQAGIWYIRKMINEEYDDWYDAIDEEFYKCDECVGSTCLGRVHDSFSIMYAWQDFLRDQQTDVSFWLYEALTFVKDRAFMIKEAQEFVEFSPSLYQMVASYLNEMCEYTIIILSKEIDPVIKAL